MATQTVTGLATSFQVVVPDAGTPQAAAPVSSWQGLPTSTLLWASRVGEAARKGTAAGTIQTWTIDDAFAWARANHLPPPASMLESEHRAAFATLIQVAREAVGPQLRRKLAELASATPQAQASTPIASAPITPPVAQRPSASSPVTPRPAAAATAAPTLAAAPAATQAPDPLLDAIDELKGQSAASSWLRTMASKAQLRVERDRNKLASQVQLNVCFAGPEGVGKRLAAGIYAQVLLAIGALKSDEVTVLDVRAILDDPNGELEKELKSVRGGMIFLDHAEVLDPKKHGDALRAIAAIAKKNTEPGIVFAGEGAVKSLVEGDYRLEPYFERHVEFKALAPEVLTEIFKQEAQKRDFELDDAGIKAALGRLRSLGRGVAKSAVKLLADAETRQAQRLYPDGRMSQTVYAERELRTLTAADLVGESPFDANGELKALKVLESRIGQDDAKKWLHRIAKLVKKNLDRQAKGEPVSELNLNAVLKGGPGTGKTSIVEVLNDVLTDLGIRNGKLVVKSASEMKGSVVGEAEKLAIKMHEEARGGVLFIDEAHNLANDPFGKKVLEALVTLSWNHRFTTTVIFAGYKDEMELMLDVDKGLRRRFPNQILMPDFTRDQLQTLLLQNVEREGYTLADGGLEAAMRVVDLARAGKDFGNAGEIENIVSGAVQRCADRDEDATALTGDDFGAIDVSPEKAIEKLAEFVGFEHVIEQIQKVGNALQDLKDDGLAPNQHVEPYIAISGPPGTGKTSSAQALAETYYSYGVIASPEVVTVNALELMADFAGQTKTTVKDIVRKAMGKFLLIDEVGALVNAARSGDPFAKQAVQALLTELEGNRGRFICGFAGYEEHVKDFLALDEGLPRRVNTRIRLKALDTNQAVELFNRNLKKIKRTLHPAAAEALPGLMESLRQAPSWSSGGDIRTLINKVQTEHSTIRRKPEYADWDRNLVSAEALKGAIAGMIVDKNEAAKEDVAREADSRRPFKLTQAKVKTVEEQKPLLKELIAMSESQGDPVARARVLQKAEEILAGRGLSPEDAMDALSDPNSALAQELAKELDMEPEEIVNELTSAASDAQVVTETDKKKKGWRCMFCGSQNPSCPYKSLPNREDYNAIKDVAP